MKKKDQQRKPIYTSGPYSVVQEGESVVKWVRVELNGVIYRLELYPDA